MDNAVIGQFILYMVALIFSLSLHEAMHAWMSNRFGDDLAHSQGRVSLSPVTHVDPIGTLLFPAIAFFTHAPLLGWARPTPVNPLRWREKRKANFWVSIAGVLGNLAIAIVAGVIIRVLYHAGQLPVAPNAPTMEAVFALLRVFFELNIGLAVFNLFPIPPLDGSKILSSILPESFGSAIESIEQYGFIILLIALVTGVFRAVFSVVMPLAWNILFVGVA
ncbi:MAG TPA: site-2 protease family protein [Pyrinomonadaceae bacterium]|jgi:Zn-dependent protease